MANYALCLSLAGKPYMRRELSKYMREKLSERLKAKWQDKDYREKINYQKDKQINFKIGRD